MSQNLTFTQTVNQLFFGVDVSENSSQLLDSFLAVSKLHHNETVNRQSSLNINMQMESDKQAWASRHIFSFTESPLPDLKISKGIIEITIGEAGDMTKVLDLNWKLEFESKVAAGKYFEKLKQIFSQVSTDKRFEEDKDVGEIAQFSIRKPNNGVRDIVLFFNQAIQSKQYELSLSFGNDLMDD